MSLASFARVRRFGHERRTTALVLQAAGTVSAVFVPALLVVVALIIDLLATGGDVYVARGNLAEIEAWAGPPDRVLPDGAWYYDRGLLPQVVQFRGTALGAAILRLYQSWPPLGKSELALLNLIVVGSLLLGASGLSWLIVDRGAIRLAADAATRLRMALFHHALGLAGEDALGGAPLDASSLMRERVDAIQRGLAAWWRVVPRAVVLAAFLVGLIIAVDVPLATSALLITTGAALMVAWLERRSRYLRALRADRAAHQMTMVVEGLDHLRLARGRSLEDLPGEPFLTRLERYRRAAWDRDASDLARRPIRQLMLAAVSALVLALVGMRVLSQPPRLTLVGAIVLCGGLVLLYLPVSQWLRMQSVIRRADHAARAVFALLDRHLPLAELPGAVDLRVAAGELRFVEVTLVDHAGRKLLENATFTIPPRGIVAVMSSDPPATRALAGLLLRFFDPTSGQVLLDGQELRSLTFSSLRRQVAFMLGADSLFTGSVAENIRCGNQQATADDVIRAAKHAEAYDLIQHLPHGFDTIVGRHGMRLASSEAFRVAAARTALQNPAVVLVEEPGDDGDARSAAAIDAALSALARHRTLLIVPSRTETLASVDRVLVFHRGRLAHDGTHQELVASSKLYRRLQFARFDEYGSGGR